MRSNIARTWGSDSLPRVSAGAAVLMTALLQAREEVDECVELLRVLLLEGDERRHRRGGVHERARDRVPRQPSANVRQLGPRPGVAVLSDLVAALAARLRGHGSALLVLGRHLQRD